ncbi:MAG TPA: hypothetical protein VL490_06540 [Mucilaginibacter sp.]|nr:hypothetical protein [Mucilaginibacter sp.]
MKKAVLVAFLFFVIQTAFSQDASYKFPLPAKWGEEKISFPIQFAIRIPYTGVEEIHFAPGWANINSDEYWSYVFLWYVEGTPNINNSVLQSQLVKYYNGLFKNNNKIEVGHGNITQCKIQRVKTEANDKETYEGKINTLNFQTRNPIHFYTRIHIRNYNVTSHSALLFEISPKSYDHKVWNKLNRVTNSFQF